MILIYTSKITPRIKYTFNLMFRDVYGLPFRLSSSKEEFVSYEGAKLHYGYQPIADELFVQSKGLLLETGICDQDITVFNWNNTKAFFSVGPKSCISFDIFSASFFLASRYEEYLPHIRDQHDRFDAPISLAYNYNFLHQPVINKWAEALKDIICKRFPELVFPKKKYRFITTIDIDNAYAYLEKGFVRTMGGIAKSLTTLNFAELSERIKVLLGSQKDPYDTYQFQ